jgi:proline iminopeptidase
MHITINGAEIFFDVAGSTLSATPDGPRARPAMLVLHGGPGFDHWAMRSYFDRFADVVQVVYLDHRGNGRSRGGNGSDPTMWNLAQWGDDIAAFSDALGLIRPIVLGQSFGGMVAQSYAARHPGHARGLIFSSTAARMTIDEVIDGFVKIGGEEVRAAATGFWSRGSDEDIATFMQVCTPLYNTSPRDPMAAKGTMYQWDMYRHFSLPGGEIWKMNLLPGLAAVPGPIMVLTGDRDPVTPPEKSREIFAVLKADAGVYVEVPGTGHGAFRDKPDEVEIILRDFIKGCG